MQDDIDRLLGVDQERQKRSTAQLILKLKECKQVSQVVIDEVVDGWKDVFQHTVRRLRASVMAKLSEASSMKFDSHLWIWKLGISKRSIFEKS